MSVIFAKISFSFSFFHSFFLSVTTVAAFIRNVACRVRQTPPKISDDELYHYVNEAKDLLGPDTDTDLF